MIVAFLSKILNILPHEWPRVAIAWTISVFARIGYIMGWTVITAIFVYRLGIEKLPYLYIAYGAFTIMGTLIYATFTHYLSKELNIMISVISGSILLYSATEYALHSSYAFFLLVIAAAAIFFAQLQIHISIFIEELFSPMESQRTFPIIESAETIGGILGGVLTVIFVSLIAPHKLLYGWIILSLAIIPALFFFSKKQKHVPHFESTERTNQNSFKKVLKGFRQIKKNSFLKGLLCIVILHWIFISLLEFQYTKSLDQNISNTPEATLVYHQKSEKSHIQGSVLSVGNQTVISSQPTDTSMIREQVYEEKLTEGLGKLHILFSVSALFMQLFIAGRLMKHLGIIGSLLLHPLVAFLNTIGLTLRFNLMSAIIAKTGYEITGVLHKNAYHSSYYALPHENRATAKEFLEGVGKPLGMIVGTVGLIILQHLYSHNVLTFSINSTMFFVITLMLIILFSLQKKYTFISKKQLLIEGEHPNRFHAIEILSQKGHHKAGDILTQIISSPKEPTSIKEKALEALGIIKDPETIPDIVEILNHPSEKIKAAALTALGQFHNLKKHLFSQSFSRFRVLVALKKLFKEETSTDIKTATIRLFAKLNESDIVPFILEILEKTEKKVRASCINAIKDFDDISTAYYIKKYLHDSSADVVVQTAGVLWKYKKFQAEVRQFIEKKKKSKRIADQEIALRIIGKIGDKKNYGYLRKMFKSESDRLEHAATIALAHMEEDSAYEKLIKKHSPKNITYAGLQDYLQKLPLKIQERIKPEFKKIALEKIHELHHKYQHKTLDTLDKKVLKELREYYQISGAYDQVYRIDLIINNKA